MTKRSRHNLATAIAVSLPLLTAGFFLGCRDGSSALSRPADRIDYRPIPAVAVVSDQIVEYDEGRSRLTNLLNGMGLGFDLIDNAEMGSKPLVDYDLVILAGSSSREFTVDSSAESTVIDAINAGTNVLWVGGGIWGTFKTTRLPDAFGLRYMAQGWSDEMGITKAQFVTMEGSVDSFVVHKENVFRTAATTATVDGVFLGPNGSNTGIPFIVRHTGDEEQGTTVYVSMPILDFWKSTESYDTYARAEILYRYIVELTDKGSVAVHPVLDGKDGVLMLRLEDYTPGGSWFRKSIRRFSLGMEHLLDLAADRHLPINVSIVPKYSHPFINEYHRWDDRDPGIKTLRQQAQRALGQGGSLIVHGFDHQNGDEKDDLSGDDWEMWNEEAGQFLSLEKQREVTDSAFAEVERVWGIKPQIWETPHYAGNEDTYRAAAASGFKYVTESDTKLFPNRSGFLNTIGGHLLNIPETGFDFRWEPEDIRTNTLLKQLKIFPRVMRMRGLYLVFYHNISMQQHKGLENFLETAAGYDLWKPNMEDYAAFWIRRENAQLSPYRHATECRMLADVTNGFDGLALSFRLPDGASPAQVRINGALAKTKSALVAGHWVVYPVLSEPNSEVVVTYLGDNCAPAASDQ